MTKHKPPVPPANQSKKGPGENKAVDVDTTKDNEAMNPEKQGQQANTKQNIRHQGYQQYR
ncbi:MAG: hypothetical protein SGJ17_10175 [Hyphomicrobiales bacterium]|nr:hypothetical protein [Hyphomicrobiales bacterium]